MNAVKTAASQTEGMGGDAVRKALETIIAKDRTGPMLYEKRWDGIEQPIGNADGEYAAIARAALAALTPPETAEAVPDEAGQDTVAQGVELWRCVHLGGERDFWTSDDKQAENCASTGRYNVSRHVIRLDPEARAATASDPAPATDDRERLVEALREAAAPFVRHYADWMNKWPDDQEVSVFPRHTYGEIRALSAALATEASR